MTAREVPPAIAAMRATAGVSPWRPPTRRTFLAMLGLGGAVLGMRRGVTGERPRSAAVGPGRVRWIGHC